MAFIPLDTEDRLSRAMAAMDCVTDLLACQEDGASTVQHCDLAGLIILITDEIKATLPKAFKKRGSNDDD